MFVLQIHGNQVENTINLLLPYLSIVLLQQISMTRYETVRKYFLIFFPQQNPKGFYYYQNNLLEDIYVLF